jgi:endonuclease III
VSEKSKVIQLLDTIKPGWTPPAPLEDGDLLQQGLLFVLSRTLTEAQAHQTVRALRAAYPDWNELRISQIQEFREQVKTKSDDTARAACNDVRTYLQEIFQENHGFDLEFMRDDPAAAGKMISELKFLGGGAGHLLLSLASNGELPVTQGIVRVLDRVGVVARAGSVKKAKEKLAPLVPEARVRDFALRLGEVAERYCDPKKPICWECPLVEGCKHGRRVQKDWMAQQKRLEVQRKKEEKRLEILRKKDEAREKREAERSRKKAEAAARKAERELAKRKRAEEAKKKKLAVERQRREKEEAKKRAVVEAKAAAKKALEAEKKRKAAERERAKKAAAKKAKAKKPAAKKPAAKKKTTKKAVTRRKKAAGRAAPVGGKRARRRRA